MKIKSLEELQKIRQQSSKKVNVRVLGEESGDHIEIMVGMATCGIASGARQTMNAIVDEIKKQNLDYIKVVQVGCLGYCHSEPIIQVNMPGKKPILYGKVNETKGREIIIKHILQGQMLEDLVIEPTFERI